MQRALLLVLLAFCTVQCTPTYESVSYCQSSFTCQDGSCVYPSGKTCELDNEFTEPTCGNSVECQENDGNFCCTPDSVGDTFCVPITSEGRFNSVVTETCVASVCTRSTEFCVFRVVYVDVGPAPPTNDFSAFFEGLTMKTRKLNDTLFDEPLVEFVGPWEWKRNEAVIDLIIDTNDQNVAKNTVVNAIEEFTQWVEAQQKCEVDTPAILYHFGEQNAEPIEVTVEISIYGNLMNSTGTSLQADVFVPMLPIFSLLLNMFY